MKIHRFLMPVLLLSLVARLAAGQPALVLEDEGLQFPDGSVQETSALLPAGPPSATVAVDCDAGDTIAEALKTPAARLTIEISGVCHETITTSRPDVVFRGTDPITDGIDATGASGEPLPNPLNLIGTWGVDIENLKFVGGAGGLGINATFSVDVINCRLENNTYTGAFVSTGSNLIRFWNTVVTGNGNRGLTISSGSGFSCTDCTIEQAPDMGTGIGIACSEGSTVSLNSTTVEGKTPIYASGCAVRGANGTLEAKPNSMNQGSAIWAVEQTAVNLDSTSVVGPIWAFDHSSLDWNDVPQSEAVGVTSRNALSSGSTLVANGTTSLFGDLPLDTFATAVIGVDASLSGSLACESGADAFCADPGDVTGTSNCDRCVKP